MEWIRYKEVLCLFYCLTFLCKPHLLTRHEVRNSERTLEEEGSPKQKCHKPSKCVINIVLHAGYGSIYCMAAYKISSRQTTKTKRTLNHGIMVKPSVTISEWPLPLTHSCAVSLSCSSLLVLGGHPGTDPIPAIQVHPPHFANCQWGYFALFR